MLGLLLLEMISPALRMDFRALMTLSGITREGQFEAGKRVPDPDQGKRRRLRDIIVSLETSQLINTEKVDYADIRHVKSPGRLLDHIPKEGIICWAGAVLYLKRRPIGLKTSVFGLNIPKNKIINWWELKTELPMTDQLTTEFCVQEVRSVCDSLTDLCRKNLIEQSQVFEQLHHFNEIKSDSMQTRLATLYVASFEESRGINRRLRAILPFFELEQNE
jgi:hypothetical protein